MSWPSRIVPLALSAALALPTAALARNYVGQVQAQLVRNLEAADEVGLSLSHKPWLGTLTDGHYRTNDIVLRARVRYVLTAACDEDCADIDLVLRNRFGQIIAADTDPDYSPVITVTPTETATFSLRAVMVSCSANPCAYGIGVFSNE
jgi:hypothetical protein